MIYFTPDEKVRILRNKRNQKNKLHVKYHNMIGTIVEQQGKCYKVSICFKRKVFLPIVSIDQLTKL